MRCILAPSQGRALVFLLLFVVALLAPARGRAGTRQASGPAGVCYPVNGAGYMVSQRENRRLPVGTLSPLLEGDSLIVQSGTITFVDFRTGQSPVYGAGSRVRIPPIRRAGPPSWWQRLQSHVIRSLSQPELERVGGSVRGLERTFWPDTARFAPEVAILFEWSGINPAPVAIRVAHLGDSLNLAVVPSLPGHGGLLWQPPAADPSGDYTWDLLDADGDRLGGGSFMILTKEAAETERARFRRAAEGMEPFGLSAALLAEAEHAILW